MRPLQKRILVVDDEPLVCQSVKMVLACDGHTAITAASGMEALCKLSDATFDLMFTDFTMPGMKGDQLACAAKERSPLPVILLTGFPPKCKPDKIDLVVLKPFSPEDLRNAIEAVGCRS